MGRETELLLHHGDAELMRLLWRKGSDRAAVDQDLTTVGPQRARQQIDQRALARSILAEEGMDAAGDKLDRDFAKHRIAEESLRDIPRSEDHLLHAHLTALLYGAKLLLQALRDQLVEQLRIVGRVDVAVRGEVLCARKVAVEIAFVDDRQGHVDVGRNVIALQPLHGGIDGEGREPIWLLGPPSGELLLLPHL